MTRGRSNGKTEAQTGLQVSKFGRVLKKKKEYETVFIRGREPRYGKWTTRDKRKLLDCLKRNDCIYNNANFVYKSIGAKQRQPVDEYLKRLRKKAAHHSDAMRRKQPPILTWFQVADELTWLKADEDLYEAMGTMLSIYTVEANNMQEKYKTNLSFANLYKYVKALQKEEKLPDLTPAESVTILDCFQHLADTLRTCDCTAQDEFMRAQYQKYFKLLYMTPAPKKASGKQGSIPKEKTDKGNTDMGNTDKGKTDKGKKGSKKTTPPQKANQNTSQRPLMKAQLIKKTDKRKSRRKQKLVKTGESLAEGQGQSSSQQTNEDGEQGSPQQVTESTNQVSVTVVEEESGATESAVGRDGTVGEEEASEERRLPSSNPDSKVDSGSVEALNENDVPEDLDPDSPDFLARFANGFSLGSLNPFEIPTDLLYLHKKGQESGEVPLERSSSVPVDGTISPVDSHGSNIGGESDQEDEDLFAVDLTTQNTGS